MATRETGIGVREVNGRFILTAYKIVDEEQIHVELAESADNAKRN